MMTEAPHVLVVDDDAELCELLGIRLAASGYRTSTASSVASAFDLLSRERIDVALLDLRLGNEDGFEVLAGAAKRAPDLQVVVLTAHGSIETAVDAMKRGAYGFVTKPFHDAELLQKIAHAVDERRLRQEVAGLRRIVGAPDDEARLIGVSAAIEDVRRRIAVVGPTDATVLVLGESGTGKELVARSLHAVSPRAKGPFVAVNCASLAPELLESTLFGHTRGSFTGAVGDREGLLRAARRGTLFLDEVGETPPAVQAKLLRFLEDRRYTRVGSNIEEAADVRIIAATNRDLRQEVAERRFREDLFYRLHVVPIEVPPLRDRGEDVSVLAELFLDRAAARHGVKPPRLDASALAALVAHAWPGNVRELANVIEAAVLLCGDGDIQLEHLPGVGLPGAPAPEGGGDDLSRALFRVIAAAAEGESARVPSLREVRDAAERTYLELVLSRSNGNVALAARTAHRNRTDFYDLLRRHNLSPASFKRT